VTSPRAAAAGAPRHETIDALAAAGGRDAGILAGLVVQHRREAEAVLLASLVEASRDPRLPAGLHERRLHLLRRTTRRAIAAARTSGGVDPHVAGPLDPGTLEVQPSWGPPAIAGGALVSAMAVLPPRLRAAVALRWALDLSPAEIASVMGASHPRVARDLHEALERLRGSLGGGAPVGLIEEITDV
jgi:DNA-directed RNA polymerase specialized sigma24 family protein